MDILLTKGADPKIRNNDGQIPLDLVSEGEFPTKLAYILRIAGEAPETRDKRLFLRAVRDGALETVQHYLDIGMDPNTKNDDYWRIWNDNWRGWTALHWAIARRNHTEALSALLAAGVNTESRDLIGRTPLHWVAAHGRMDFMFALLAAGADPDARDNDSRTPADLAHANGHTETAAVLRSAMAP